MIMTTVCILLVLFIFKPHKDINRHRLIYMGLGAYFLMKWTVNHCVVMIKWFKIYFELKYLKVVGLV